MTLPTATAFRRSGSPRLRPLARAHPLAGVLLLTFAFSWGHWVPQALAGAATTVVVMLAAVVILRRQVPRTTPVGAPVLFEGRVEVRCSPTEAFELLANTDRYATGPGSPVLRMDRVSPGAPRVGTRWREVIRLGPLLRMTVWSEIVALDAPVLLRLRFRLPGMRGTLTYRIGPGSAGTTLVQQEQTFEVAGRLARLRRLMILHLWTARARERLQDIRSHTRSVRTTAPNARAELMDAPRAAAG